jgi:ferrous iron transport protein A
MNRKIKDLEIGDTAIIAGYEKTGEQYRQKLLSMGLTRGTEITVTKCAPLGDPVELLVRGFKLSLRKVEADILLLKGGSNE